MAHWKNANEITPKCSRTPGSLGTPVLVWPYTDECNPTPRVMLAYYGQRISNEPTFYLYGRVIDVTHWCELPEPPR